MHLLILFLLLAVSLFVHHLLPILVPVHYSPIY